MSKKTMASLPNEAAVRLALQGQSVDTNFECNYLVEAGAGAGKTTVIVGRIVEQLVQGICQPEELVAITFTVKSTQETQARLESALQERIDTATDTVEKERLQGIFNRLGLMQISTIHSFCKTMLSAMPFETPMGMELSLLPRHPNPLETYFHTRFHNEVHVFGTARQVNLDAATLYKGFAKAYATHGASIVYDPINSPSMQAEFDAMIKTSNELHDKFKDILKDVLASREIYHLDRTFANLLTQGDFQTNPDAQRDFALFLCKSNFLPTSYMPEFKDILESYQKTQVAPPNYAHLLSCYDAFVTLWQGEKRKLCIDKSRYVVHAETMPVYEAWLADYEEQKQALHQVDENDLLLKCRDMLRDSATAREYFHNRYRCLYVDEFQDTDPVQAEFLFYLTHSQPTLPSQWTDCTPTPGSLFLVGDPKQSIYRFRGADISVYNKVKDLMNAGCGETVFLANNFRSTKEICDLADAVFKSKPKTPTWDSTHNHSMSGGPYQTTYASMMPQKTGGLTVHYELQEKLHADGTKKKGKLPTSQDANNVAAFIRTMVDEKCPITVKGVTRPAQFKDFMVLTTKKGFVNVYEQACAALDIPTRITGSQHLAAVPVIARGLCLLAYVAEPNNLFALTAVLKKNYGIDYPTMRKACALAGENTLLAFCYGDKVDVLVQHTDDAGILALCAAMNELRKVTDRAPTMMPLSLLQWMFDGGFHLWKETESQKDWDVQYAYVQQFLSAIGDTTIPNLATLLRQATICAETEQEYQLALQKDTDAVRIMNLHKAKGLESPVVILPSASSDVSRPDGHLDWDNQALYLPLTMRNGGYPVIKAMPKAWKEDNCNDITWEAQEKGFLKAEYTRLLYVAATRAEFMLVVSNEGYFKPVAEKCTPIDTADLTYGKAYEALQSATPSQTPVPAPKPGLGAVNTEVVEQSLGALVDSLCESDTFAISPSRLDAKAPRKKSEEDDGDVVVVQPYKPTPRPAPYGAQWGTIIHEVMELCVKYSDFTESGIREKCAESVTNNLDENMLNNTQRQQLFGDQADQDEPTRKVWLIEKAATAVAFLQDANSPLRTLLTEDCYPEMTFFLHEADKTSDLHHHLTTFMKEEDAKDKALQIEGIIDLAIWTDKGWVIVDYKTDSFQPGEQEDAYRRRLYHEYKPQIESYAKVLGRQADVVGLYLCAIPLGGDLIDLQAAAVNPPKKTTPGVAVDTLLLPRNRFGDGIQESTGAQYFSLLCNGKPIALVDKQGTPTFEVKKCRQFAVAVCQWLDTVDVGTVHTVDDANAGTVLVLKRLLKVMRQSLNDGQWAAMSIQWKK